MPRTLEQIDQDLSAAEVRLNQVDGQNLTLPDLGMLTQIVNQVNAMRNDIRQAVLTLDGELQRLTALVNTLQSQLTTHLGGGG